MKDNTSRNRILLASDTLKMISSRLGGSETYIRKVCDGKVAQRRTALQRNITRLANRANR